MGRIFSYEEVVNGQVPNSHTFHTAAETFNALSQRAIEAGSIDGAFIYGSVAIGSAGRQSDFDVFLALAKDNIEAYDTAQDIISGVRLSTEDIIPLVPIIQPRLSLEQGRHEMDRFFGQHLASPYRTVHGNDPAAYITYPDAPAGRLLTSYLFHKRRRLTNAFSAASPLDFSDGNGVQRMLELPTAVGRKTLQALAKAGYIENAVDKSADKQAVLEATRLLLIQEGLEEDFDTLVDQSRIYRILLDDAMDGLVLKQEYEDEIKGIHSKLPTAIMWLSQLEQALLSKCLSE